MKKTTNDWIVSAKSDLQLIRMIIGEESISHLAAFHAQLAIEKLMKAIVEEFDMGFIKTHSLETLYHKVETKMHIAINKDLLILLDQLYIDARYPGDFGLLPHGRPSAEEIHLFLNLADQFYETAVKICK